MPLEAGQPDKVEIMCHPLLDAPGGPPAIARRGGVVINGLPRQQAEMLEHMATPSGAPVTG